MSTWQAIRATRAEAADRVEADKATAINDFLVDDLLVQAQPWTATVALSDRLTLRQVVDRAAERVGERFRTRPPIEAALRTTIGGIYLGLGGWDRSRDQFARGAGDLPAGEGPPCRGDGQGHARGSPR